MTTRSGADSGTACETYSKLDGADDTADVPVGDRYDVTRDGVDENVTTNSGCASRLRPGDMETGRVMKPGNSADRGCADGVVRGVTTETPPAGVGMKIEGSISGDSGSFGSATTGAAATGVAELTFGASDSARSFAIASTRLADTGTCVRACVAGNSVSSAGVLLCAGRAAGRGADGAMGASMPYTVEFAAPAIVTEVPAPVGTSPCRASASAVFGDALPSIIAT